MNVSILDDARESLIKFEASLIEADMIRSTYAVHIDFIRKKIQEHESAKLYGAFSFLGLTIDFYSPKEALKFCKSLHKSLEYIHIEFKDDFVYLDIGNLFQTKIQIENYYYYKNYENYEQRQIDRKREKQRKTNE